MDTLFLYEDEHKGKIYLGKYFNSKPYSKVFDGEYREEFIEYVDDIIEKAKTGNLPGKTDALLTMALFLEKKWSIPESLSNYISKILTETIIAFGHTEGRAEKRNSSMANALGLILPKGRNDISSQSYKYKTIHSYIWWRIYLYKETLYTAAKQAEEAFKGTNRLSQDACEKIFNEEEERRKKRSEMVRPCLSMFADLKLTPDLVRQFKGRIAFKDDDFLRDTFPFYEPLDKEEEDDLKSSLGI